MLENDDVGIVLVVVVFFDDVVIGVQCIVMENWGFESDFVEVDFGQGIFDCVL